jgi:chromosomal replication initiator protein
MENQEMFIKDLWGKALVEIELNLSKPNFNTWFKNTSIIDFKDGVISIGVANEFMREWFLSKYHKLILKTLRDINDNVRGIEYVVSKSHDPLKIKNVPVKEKEINETPSLPLSIENLERESGLNPKYTFHSFVVGPFNELAYVAAQSILKAPGEIYNPFFVYGGTGLGKTHLIQALGNSIKTNYPYKKIFYTSLEQFSNEYVAAVNSNKIATFKEKYKKYDVFIMDDIQFIKGKEKTQEELFHIFNYLYDFNKQIIFSSDKHPNFIVGLEDRLKSRFGAGMIIDISSPDYESRLALLKTKTNESHSFISEEVLSFIAENITGSIRELEGILNTVIAGSNLKGRILYTHEVKDLIKHNIKSKKIHSPREIIKIIANFYNIKEEDLCGKSRRKDVVVPRQISMYFLREFFDVSYPLIGEKLGGKDHTTVMHSVEKIKKDLIENRELQREIEELKELCV